MLPALKRYSGLRKSLAFVGSAARKARTMVVRMQRAQIEGAFVRWRENAMVGGAGPLEVDVSTSDEKIVL